jgi:hypothetical protein
MIGGNHGENKIQARIIQGKNKILARIIQGKNKIQARIKLRRE